MGKELKTPLFTIIFLLVGLFLYTKLAGPIPFSVNSVTTTKQDFFRVDGVGEASTVPNTAQISLGVTKNAATVAEAQNQTNAAITKILDELKKLGIEQKDMKTTNYSVSPNYDQRPVIGSRGEQQVSGYTVSQNIEVKVRPLEKANQAVDVATAQGANIIGGLTFVLDDETRQKLEDEARQEAVKKAKEKAQSLSKAAGIRLGRIIDIQESRGGMEPLRYDIAQKGNVALESQPTQLTPGENTVRITVSLAYQTN